jgi:hypothetical protein
MTCFSTSELYESRTESAENISFAETIDEMLGMWKKLRRQANSTNSLNESEIMQQKRIENLSWRMTAKSSDMPTSSISGDATDSQTQGFYSTGSSQKDKSESHSESLFDTKEVPNPSSRVATSPELRYSKTSAEVMPRKKRSDSEDLDQSFQTAGPAPLLPPSPPRPSVSSADIRSFRSALGQVDALLFLFPLCL